MIKYSLLRRLLTLFCLGLLVVGSFGIGLGIVHPRSVTAQSITGVNSELMSLRARVDRLESEINRFSQSFSRSNQSNRPTISPPRNSPAIVNDRAIGRSDPMFERLANLVIELKEDVRDLQKRITNVEKIQNSKF